MEKQAPLGVGILTGLDSGKELKADSFPTESPRHPGCRDYLINKLKKILLKNDPCDKDKYHLFTFGESDQMRSLLEGRYLREGTPHDKQGKKVPGRGPSNCKDPEVGMGLACSRIRKANSWSVTQEVMKARYEPGFSLTRNFITCFNCTNLQQGSSSFDVLKLEWRPRGLNRPPLHQSHLCQCLPTSTRIMYNVRNHAMCLTGEQMGRRN